MAKFFVMIDHDGMRNYYDLFVCDDDTPIPTAKEIVERNQLNEWCAENKVKRVSRLRWFFLLMCGYARYIFSRYAEELIDYAPQWWQHSLLGVVG